MNIGPNNTLCIQCSFHIYFASDHYNKYLVDSDKEHYTILEEVDLRQGSSLAHFTLPYSVIFLSLLHLNNKKQYHYTLIYCLSLRKGAVGPFPNVKQTKINFQIVIMHFRQNW